MIAYALLGIALLVGIVLILRWFVQADPKTLMHAGKWLLLAGVSAAALLLAATGRLQWILGTAAALLPWLVPLLRNLRTAKTFGRMAGMGGGGQTSDVETRFFRMTLDHDSGHLDGVIREGPYAGARLGDLDLDALLEVLVQCGRADPQSVQVLEAYLDRVHPEWRQGDHDDAAAGGDTGGGGTAGGGQSGSGSAGAGRDGAMSRDEALAILGLEPGAGEGEIKAAHHRLMAALHPDKGGSNYLAQRINEARRVLLGR
ncbi:MAG: molecular chaperone DnaJ [Rhodospirillales bacterium]|nr:MAG: molecular chaperone DnaJ [Rhodospirillales bacterium]